MTHALCTVLDAYLPNPSPLRDQALALSDSQQNALTHLLEFERQPEPGHRLRAQYEADLMAFDHALNQLAAKILAQHQAPLHRLSHSEIFGTTPALQYQQEVAEMQAHSYVVSGHRLSPEWMAQLTAALAEQDFVSSDKQRSRCRGADLLAHLEQPQARFSTSGNTYWLKDQNPLCQHPLFQTLAFDPYLLSVVAEYLGCQPIHVQTHAWFSLPCSTQRSQLSSSAQMYHQDKEFIKFVKVFIYLSDVGPEQGPHCYIQGSHLDELHRQGVPFSTRVTDADIGRYYDRSRQRTLTGPAGLIAFGDTSATHKGTPVLHGHRLLLQLEYAASLFISPVQPFADLPAGARLAHLAAPEYARVFSHYNSHSREDFAQWSAQQSAARATAKPAWWQRLKARF